MYEVLIAAWIMTGVACVFGIVLAFANRKFHVDEDPRIGQVEELLPATNCGACGQAGCRAFAEALTLGTSEPAQCTVSTAEGIVDIARLLGVAAGEREKRVARLHCAGGRSSVRQLAEYRGPQSCSAAFVVNRGGRACAWGCLGLSDCERACDFDAIHMNDEDLPVVSVDLCTACGDCVDSCPLDLFSIEPLSHDIVVQCSSPQVSDAARAACEVACDACGRCAADAGDGVIEMSRGLPIIRDPARADRTCTVRCPTDAIQWVGGQQFQYRDRERSEIGISNG